METLHHLMLFFIEKNNVKKLTHESNSMSRLSTEVLDNSNIYEYIVRQYGLNRKFLLEVE